MNKFLIALLGACLVIVGCERLTENQKASIQHGTAVIGTGFGIPAPVGEALGATLAYALGHLIGHKHGKKSAKKSPAAGLPQV